jgi:hypothetical protein
MLPVHLVLDDVLNKYPTELRSQIHADIVAQLDRDRRDRADEVQELLQRYKGPVVVILRKLLDDILLKGCNRFTA